MALIFQLKRRRRCRKLTEKFDRPVHRNRARPFQQNFSLLPPNGRCLRPTIKFITIVEKARNYEWGNLRGPHRFHVGNPDRISSHYTLTNPIIIIFNLIYAGAPLSSGYVERRRLPNPRRELAGGLRCSDRRRQFISMHQRLT